MSVISDQICRLCAEINQTIEDILDNSYKEMAELIYKYISITVDSFDGMSTKICFGCKEKIIDFHNFASKCRRTQTLLYKHNSDVKSSDGYQKFKSEGDVEFKVKKEEEDSDVDYYDESVWSPVSNNTSRKSKTEKDPLKKTSKSKKGKRKTRSSSPTQNTSKRFKSSKTEILSITLPIKDEKTDDYDDMDKTDDPDSEDKNENNEITIKGNVINVKKPIKDIATVKEILKLSENDKIDIKTMNLSRIAIKKARYSQMFNFDCHLCDLKFDEWRFLSAHTKEQHQTLPEVKCICAKTLKSWATVKGHFRVHNPEESANYRCDQCFKTFGTNKQLRRHILSHTKGPKIYGCDLCSKKFSRPELVERHKKIHKPAEKRYIFDCSMCEKKFTDKFVLKHHVEVVHEKYRPFICDLCGHSFSTKHNLAEHRNIHGTEMKYVCDICSRGFKSKAGLNMHMETHSTVTYPCPHCPMVLNSQRTYKNHLYIHDENSWHPCPFCGKTFKRKKDVAVHKKVHTGERPYSCPWCSRTFANGSNCRSHKRKMHPNELRISDAKAAMKNKVIKPQDAKIDEEKINMEDTASKIIYPVEKQNLPITSSPVIKIPDNQIPTGSPNMKTEITNLTKMEISSPTRAYESNLYPLNLNTSCSRQMQFDYFK